MNKYILVIAALICALSGYSQDAQLILRGKPIFKQYPPQLQKESPYNAIGLPAYINAIDTVINVTVKNKNGEYYRFGPRLSIYLKPGSKVILDYDYRNSYLSKFSGDLVKENVFLNCVILLSPHNLEKNLNYTLAKSYEEFCAIIKLYEESLLSQCKTFKKEKSFYDDCQARIDFSIAMAHSDFLAQRKMIISRDVQDKRVLEDKIKELEDSILPRIKQYVISKLSKYDETKIMSYRQGYDLLGSMNNHGAFSKENGYDRYSDIYDYSIVKFDVEYMYSPNLLTLASKVNEKIVLDDINSFLNDNQRLFKGAPFKDAEVMDVQGKTCKLSDLKGSVLYIDIWATWCNPCKALAPSFYALANSMSDCENIKFISVSIDTKFDIWERYMDKHPHAENVTAFYLNDDDFVKHNNITAIPRFILVDKDFKVRAAYASKPFENRIDIIKELLKKMSRE